MALIPVRVQVPWEGAVGSDGRGSIAWWELCWEAASWEVLIVLLCQAVVILSSSMGLGTGVLGQDNILAWIGYVWGTLWLRCWA